LALLARIAPRAPWMAAGLGVDLEGLVGDVVARDGHVRVGLEDAPFGTSRPNSAIVETAAGQVVRAGSEPASPAEVRTALAVIDRDGGTPGRTIPR
jgi:3-keto-5-aminohexanoate cleavage enzyme